MVLGVNVWKYVIHGVSGIFLVYHVVFQILDSLEKCANSQQGHRLWSRLTTHLRGEIAPPKDEKPLAVGISSPWASFKQNHRTNNIHDWGGKNKLSDRGGTGHAHPAEVFLGRFLRIPLLIGADVELW